MGNGKVKAWAVFLESPNNLWAWKVCPVCIQDQSFNNFKSDKMKLSVNKAQETSL